MQIGGYNDTEVAESWKQQISQKRAEAVLAALRERDLPLPDVTARGYGETAPVADNATAEGRAQNRRIAFTLVTAEGDGSQ
jgi:OOP family OmpA-OmpF porin